MEAPPLSALAHEARAEGGEGPGAVPTGGEASATNRGDKDERRGGAAEGAAGGAEAEGGAVLADSGRV
jgi:hypothetical protein